MLIIVCEKQLEYHSNVERVRKIGNYTEWVTVWLCETSLVGKNAFSNTKTSLALQIYFIIRLWIVRHRFVV